MVNFACLMVAEILSHSKKSQKLPVLFLHIIKKYLKANSTNSNCEQRSEIFYQNKIQYISISITYHRTKFTLDYYSQCALLGFIKLQSINVNGEAPMYLTWLVSQLVLNHQYNMQSMEKKRHTWNVFILWQNNSIIRFLCGTNISILFRA